MMKQQWHSHTFRAMGSRISLWLEYEDGEAACAALHQTEAMFAVAETRLTRFSETSELSRLNERPEMWVPVSNVLWRMVGLAVERARETNGLFDPTTLPALELAGYGRSFELLPAQPTLPSGSGAPCGGWQQVRFDAAQQAIWLPEGVRLDMGGIGKGVTAQQAMNFLSQWGACLVAAGGDLVAGDGPTGSVGWPVGIGAPWSQPDETPRDLLRLWLRNGSLATSGVDYRRWGNAHHLIDPRTGRPAETDVVTASVLAADASRAEAWATAALIAGLDDGLELLEAAGLPAALVDERQRVYMTEKMYPLVM